MITKSKLAIILSKINQFENPDPRLEQYPTDSEIAADMLWKANMLGDIKGKIIADNGCGTAILGLGCLLLGAKKVYFIDIDKAALKIAKKNIKNDYRGKNYSITNRKIEETKIKADVVVQNPPFGSQKRHADRVFLEKAFQAPVVYSFHIAETRAFIKKYAEDRDMSVTHYWKYSFPLKKSMKFHSKRRVSIDIGCFRFMKSGQINL